MVTNERVNTSEYWKVRLEEAKRHNDLRYSVYIGSWDRTEETHIGILNQFIEPSDSVLDAGCGYGRAAELMPGGKYTGVDISKEFIDIAKKSTYSKETEFLLVSIEDLPFSSNTFDWVVAIGLSNMLFAHIGESYWAKCKGELIRVSKKGLICLGNSCPEIYDIFRKGSNVHSGSS